ncbi:histone-lysine N-methyltransferase SETD2-like [Biomphalaria glabrata]|uniref:Histone-lysine N-methyltransferase SETD2-like n=1 Tax=Biomphalaria glabrata TaxID=6526 RepID=A0A9W2YKI3_BIOGL|nr:histone-lysine N-methyltransferase SETD2-like [Biomphalaria glabrata]
MVIQRLPTTPLIKEVLYIGSAVPLETSEGLEAIQQPLRSRYPVDNDENIQGILAVLTIVPAGIQLKYKTDPTNVVLFPFAALTMCAAVRCVKTSNASTGDLSVRFVSLTSPEAGGHNSDRPVIFTAITRRTKGRQVLECHGFITETPKDAMDLVQWTAIMDKRSKVGGYSTLSSGHQSATYEPIKVDTSFQTETASLPDFPIQLTPGESMAVNTSPAFYKEPPSTGYFYSTKNAQVKKYALHKFGGASSVADDTHSVIIPAVETAPGYAASHYSASAIVPPSRPPIVVPLRPYIPPPPPLMRPVLMAPAPMAQPIYAFPRPRFFSPPPPATILRARPVPVFVPPPPSTVYYDVDPRARPRHRSFSSRSASSSSSSPDTSRVNGHTSRKSRTSNVRDDSSVSSSRPRTPPTDYDAPKGFTRLSRRSEYYQRQNGLPYHQNGTLPGYTSAKGLPVPSNGFYVVPQYGYYGTSERPKSVPPYGSKHSSKKKEKKSKKNKKDKKKGSKKNSNGLDESSDSLAGYHSEVGQNSDSRQPRDFRRFENQFKHERAFSKSLSEETRHSVRGDTTHDAYALNTSIHPNDKEFPMY